MFCQGARIFGQVDAKVTKADGEPGTAEAGVAVLPEFTGAKKVLRKVCFQAGLKAEESEGGGFRVGRKIDAERGATAIVPAAIGTAAAEDHAFGESDAAAKQAAIDAGGGALEGDEGVGSGFDPGGGSGEPRPAGELTFVPDMVLDEETEEPGKVGAFLAFLFEKPGDAAFEVAVEHAAGAMERDGKRRGPVGFNDLFIGAPRAIGELPGADKVPAALPVGLFHLMVEGEETIGGRFQPGAFSGEVTPAAVGVLGGDQSFHAFGAVGAIHAIYYRPGTYGTLGLSTKAANDILLLRLINNFMRLHSAILIPLIALGLFGETAPRTTRFVGLAPVFEENGGQADPGILFLARDSRGTLAVTKTGARVSLVKRERDKQPMAAEVELQFPGADWSRVTGEAALPSYTNLLIGDKPEKWTKKAAHFGAVRIAGVYPGVDLVFHARRGVVEFDFEVAPGADASRARFRFPGRTPALQADGSLRVSTEAGDLVLPKPVAFQDQERIVAGRFVMRGGEARFALGAYDRGKKLTIDPAISYMTFFGGTGADSAGGLAVDAAGNIYLGGATSSTNFTVTRGTVQGTLAAPLDGFVSKFNSAGVLQYSTLLGGNGTDVINDIAVDSQGSVYFCGATASTNFPLAGAIQPNNRGGSSGQDAMFGKLNPTGTSLVYSTYYGGNFTDRANACTIDTEGNLYVTGYTISDAFPFTPGAFQTSNRSPIAGNGFVTKIAPLGDRAVFSTFIGGGIDDSLSDIAIDRNRNIYVVGQSFSTNYPTVGAFQATNRGSYDAVLTKLNAAGTALTFSTFLGAAQDDTAFCVEVDGSDNVYIAGRTFSSAFPTSSGALKKDLEGPSEMFLAKFDSSGSTLMASTLFGGNRDEEPYRVALDRSGSFYVTGWTSSPGIRPVDAVQTTLGGARDAFVLKMNSGLDAVQMFTFLGGPADELGLSMALDSAGRILVTGTTGSTSLETTTNAAQRVSGGLTDAFLAIIDSSTAANPFTVSTTRLTFTGTAGAAIPRQQFTIRATAGVPEWTIDATTVTGGAWLTATPRTGSGNATIDVAVNTTSLAAGNYEGSLAVNNTRLGTRTIVAVALTVGSAGGTVPDNGVVSAATFTGGPVAPGLLVTIFGSGIGPATLTTAQVTSAGALATTLADTRVLFDGVAAPLVYVSATQLSAIVPYGVAGKTTTSLQVEYRGVRTNSVPLRVTETAPGLFTANSSGKGPGAILNADNSVNTASNAAPVGGIVILYGTGEGVTDPGSQDGLLATAVYPKPRQPVTVRIGGKDAEVLYAGAAPGLVAGVFQINVRIPEGVAPGPQPVVVQIGTASSSPDVTVAVLP